MSWFKKVAGPNKAAVMAVIDKDAYIPERVKGLISEGMDNYKPPEGFQYLVTTSGHMGPGGGAQTAALEVSLVEVVKPEAEPEAPPEG